MSFDDSGEYASLPPFPRRRKDQVGEWLTWAIRLLIPALVWMEWQQMQTLESLEVHLAVTEATLHSHDQQLDQIWRTLRKVPGGP